MFLLLIPCFALADEERFCDEIPQGVLELEKESNPDGVFLDCLLLKAMYMEDYCLVLTPWGMNGYQLEEDGWTSNARVSPLWQEDGTRLFFRRHQAGQAPGPQGSQGQTFADDIGFDVIRRSTQLPQDDSQQAMIQFHWEEGALNLVGWQNPDTRQFAFWKDGQWIFCSLSGERLGSVRIDSLFEESLGASYDALPASLEEARKMEAITQISAETLFPGWILCSYEGYNAGHGAGAAYYRIENGSLTLRRVSLSSEKGIESQTDSMPVPLSAKLLARFQTEDPAMLMRGSRYGDTFLTGDAFDQSQIPLTDTVLENDLQSNGLVLLTEDASGARRIRLVEQAGNGYAMRTSQTLPEGAHLDIGHAADGEILLEWDGQAMQCGFRRMADGNWALDWVTRSGGAGSEMYRMLYCGVTKADFDNPITDIHVGSPVWRDLFAMDLKQLPATEEAAASLDLSGWVVVNNPDPADRLHLRTEPDRFAPSLGKFYNRTPAEVLEKKGDWCRVRIGLDGHLKGWMLSQYLAEGPAMDQVVPAPSANALKGKSIQEEYQNRPLFTSPAMKESDGVLINPFFEIVGVVEEELYILLDTEGNTGYLPQSWFWDGNR
jgi:hypothetical protein